MLHHDTNPAGMKADELTVIDLIYHINSNMTDTFSTSLTPSPLVNNLTGMYTPKDVSLSEVKRCPRTYSGDFDITSGVVVLDIMSGVVVLGTIITTRYTKCSRILIELAINS